jgi:hypothetical protein
MPPRSDQNHQKDQPRGIARDLTDRIPAMSADMLANLHDNALRLTEYGKPREREAAAALMPALTAELEKRAEADAAALALKTRRKRRTRSAAVPGSEGEAD